jgi:hypothetical protein
MASNL